MNTVLVVIDIQEEFDSSFDNKTIKNIKREIKKAIRNKDYIFFVEYDSCGRTDKRLRDAAKGYKNVTTVTKHDNDGSREILKRLTDKRLGHKSIKICGVNTDACVQSTVEGLDEKLTISKKKMTIKIVSDACSSGSDFRRQHRSAINQMKKLKHVTKVY